MRLYLSLTQDRHVVRYSVLGLVFGYAILHPLVMVALGWSDPGPTLLTYAVFEALILKPIIQSFHYDMVPMGLAFGLAAGMTVGAFGHRRAANSRQKDQLTRQVSFLGLRARDLEKEIVSLTIQNERLSKLERANRLDTEYLIHDFKTHLACILGFVNLLLEQNDRDSDTDSTLALRRIRRQASQMMGAVGDLLDLARLKGSGEVHLEEEVTVGDLLSEAASDFCLPAHSKRLDIGLNHLLCPTIRADSRLLKRVLANLISNALKHNRPSTRVMVDAECRDVEREVLFYCYDDGVGITPDALPRLFDRFSSDSTLSNEGTGLGLAFCKAAVEAHGGRIWCESPRGQGSTFNFTVPVRGVDQP